MNCGALDSNQDSLGYEPNDLPFVQPAISNGIFLIIIVSRNAPDWIRTNNVYQLVTVLQTACFSHLHTCA